MNITGYRPYLHIGKGSYFKGRDLKSKYIKCKRRDGCFILSVLQTSGEGTFGIAGAMLSDCQDVRTCSCGL